MPNKTMLILFPDGDEAANAEKIMLLSAYLASDAGKQHPSLAVKHTVGDDGNRPGARNARPYDIRGLLKRAAGATRMGSSRR
jgi:hypothetical protein